MLLSAFTAQLAHGQTCIPKSLQDIKMMETAQNTSQTLKQRKMASSQVDYQRALAELRLKVGSKTACKPCWMQRKSFCMQLELNQTLTLLSNNTFPEPVAADQLKLVDEEQLLIYTWAIRLEDKGYTDRD